MISTLKSPDVAGQATGLAIPALFEEQARRQPDATALRFAGTTVSYAELNARANRLAHYLRARGVRPGTPVGILTERSVEMVVGLLAILKAGGAYVALDPRQPAERHRTIISDAAIRILLSHQPLSAQAEGLCQTIWLDPARIGADAMPDTNPRTAIGPEHPAYVAYTSGSTGPPKGACVPHRGVTRLVIRPSYLSITPTDIFLQFAPLAFDASTLEIWAPLLNGGTMVIFPPHEPSLQELAEFIERERITVLWLTSGLFHQIADGPVQRLHSVRQLLAGGDVLSVPHVNRVLAALPETRMINGYGPTENTTFTCCHAVREPVRAGSVPIGRPISGTSVYILDPGLRQVPAGIAGELYTGGEGVACGYLNRPALTAERFVPDPFCGTAGARMYRTGDLARRRPDGTVEFLGRIDDQIKIRGYRIEPGEIEAAILRHPRVKDAAVVAQKQPAGGLALAAFVVCDGDAAGLAPELRAQLALTLPEHAIPSTIAALDKLPLNRNGKVDRRLLASSRAAERGELSSPYRAPDSAEEASIAAIWADVLAVSPIGADDDFFELGGHSLVATLVIAEISARHGVELGPRDLYENPTVADLACLVQAASMTRADPEAVVLR